MTTRRRQGSGGGGGGGGGSIDRAHEEVEANRRPATGDRLAGASAGRCRALNCFPEQRLSSGRVPSFRAFGARQERWNSPDNVIRLARVMRFSRA